MSVRLCVKEDKMIIEKKPFSFLLPAVLTVALIFHMLPQTQAMLREIPEKLALVAEAEAKEPVKRKAAGGADEGGNGAVPAAEGAFKDGVYTGSSNGYGGEITVQVTVENGQIIDISILSAPGETDPYYSLARSLLDTVKQRQTWEVDTVSGATYSSRGILGAIRNALTGETVENEEPPSVEPVGTTSQDAFKDPAAYKDGTYYGTADGFGGEIRVEVTVKKGKIAKISVESAPDETPQYLNMAKGVISRIIKAGSPNVDTVSGATFSSTGIIDAVRKALLQAVKDPEGGGDAGGESPEGGSEGGGDSGEGGPEGGDTAAAQYEDGAYTGSGWCDDGEEFYYEINVTIRVEDGKISRVSVSKGEDESDSPEDNEFYLGWAVNGRTRSGQFHPGVPAQIVSSQNADVDIVSGATYSSDTIRSIAARIISEIPMVEGVGDGNKEEETQPENDAVGPAAVPSDLPVRDEPPAQGGEEPANGEEAPDDGRTADEEALSDREERQESVEAAGEENTDIPAEESSDPAGKEDAPDSREAQAPDAAKPDEDTANTGGDRS